MEKSFHRYLTRPSARHAFAQAEATTAIAHQIRVLRNMRGWSQKVLAQKLGTTQAAVSRLEDASYGRVSFKTLLELGKVFDVAPVVRFVSTLQLMRERWHVSRKDLEVASFEDEARHVVFVQPAGAASTSAISWQTVHSQRLPDSTSASSFVLNVVATAPVAGQAEST